MTAGELTLDVARLIVRVRWGILDVGSGVSVEWVACSHGQGTGIIVTFAGDPYCSGFVSFCPECRGPTWTLVSRDPLTVEPSIACTQHGESHHGHIRGGRWQ